MKKYELTNKTMDYCGNTLYRIRALKDFECQGRQVKAGDLGGWIESEKNLSQDGDCWIFDSAAVFDNAKIFGNAAIRETAKIFGYAAIFGNAEISGNAAIFGDAEISGNAAIREKAKIYGNAEIFGNAYIPENANISKNETDILTISHIGSRIDEVTFFRCNGSNIHVSCGCFRGSLVEFKQAVEKKHGDNKYGKEYKLAIELAKLHMEVEE